MANENDTDAKLGEWQGTGVGGMIRIGHRTSKTKISMKRWRSSMAVLGMSAAAAVASVASADTLNPGDDPGPMNWLSGDAPNEEAFVRSSDLTGLMLFAGCDALDSIPFLALGAMDFVSAQDKQRLLGFTREPSNGIVLTVSGTTKDGPFSFRTEGTGFYGTTAVYTFQGAAYAGDFVTAEQLRLLMRANSITVSARGVEHQFSAHGSARAIGRLNCAGA